MTTIADSRFRRDGFASATWGVSAVVAAAALAAGWLVELPLALLPLAALLGWSHLSSV
jgi:hypothetical protein